MYKKVQRLRVTCRCRRRRHTQKFDIFLLYTHAAHSMYNVYVCFVRLCAIVQKSHILPADTHQRFPYIANERARRKKRTVETAFEKKHALVYKIYWPAT